MLPEVLNWDLGVPGKLEGNGWTMQGTAFFLFLPQSGWNTGFSLKDIPKVSESLNSTLQYADCYFYQVLHICTSSEISVEHQYCWSWLLWPACLQAMPGKMHLWVGSGYQWVIDNGQTSCSAKWILAEDHLKYNNNQKKSACWITSTHTRCAEGIILQILQHSTFDSSPRQRDFPPPIYLQRQN